MENILKQELQGNTKNWRIKTFSSTTRLRQSFEETAKSKNNVEEKLEENYQVKNYIKLHKKWFLGIAMVDFYFNRHANKSLFEQFCKIVELICRASVGHLVGLWICHIIYKMWNC